MTLPVSLTRIFSFSNATLQQSETRLPRTRDVRTDTNTPLLLSCTQYPFAESILTGVHWVVGVVWFLLCFFFRLILTVLFIHMSCA
jgi:hypothetical protein